MGRLRGRSPHHRRSALTRVLRVTTALVAVAAVAFWPASASAHPLGNFTINHYAGIRIEPGRVGIDLVIDQAEIPTFQARLALDRDGDGTLSPAEIETGRRSTCDGLLGQVHVAVGSAAVPLEVEAAGLSFPAGAGGLPTMRSVCGLVGPLPVSLAADGSTSLSFEDRSFPSRIGWREISVVGSQVTVTAADGAGVRDVSASDRLRTYPASLLATPLDDRSVTVVLTPGGPVRPAVVEPDASPLSMATIGAAESADAARPPTGDAAAAAVPGGVTGADLPSIFRTADLTPFVVLLSILTAAALGAGHALTPGHGKTLMAAYLVGTRGTPAHALGLGLSVSLSHTAGILVLAGVILGAADVLPPDLVIRAAPVVAAASIVVIGGWMLLGEWRRRRDARAARHGEAAGLAHAHADGLEHAHAAAPDHDEAPGHHHDVGHRDADAHADPHDHDGALDGSHRHSGVTHSHLPPSGGSITWRSLFVLGLAGGLIPSTSALLILLGSIAAGRPAFGFVLVLAFGLGMAAVMAGIGLAMVVARGRLDGMPASPAFGRVRGAVPLVAAVVVFGFGIYLTVQAIGGTPTL